MARRAHERLHDHQPARDRGLRERADPGARGALRPPPPGLRAPGVSYFRYAPGFRSPAAHRHREQEEAYVVVGGSGRILLDGEVHPLRPWDVVRVSPATVRAFEASDEGLELVIVGSDRPEE